MAKTEFEDVHFKNVSIGKGVASIGVLIPVDGAVDVNVFRDLLMRARLNVSIERIDDPNQPELIDGAANSRLSSIIDTGKIGVDEEGVDVRMVFKKSEIDLAILGDFSNVRGNLSLERIGDAKAKDDEQKGAE